MFNLSVSFSTSFICFVLTVLGTISLNGADVPLNYKQKQTIIKIITSNYNYNWPDIFVVSQLDFFPIGQLPISNLLNYLITLLHLYMLLQTLHGSALIQLSIILVSC